MAPNFAAASVLGGLSLWLLRTPENPAFSPVRLITARAASVTTGLIGALSLAEFLFHLDFGIDRLLVITAPTLATAGLRLRMSPDCWVSSPGAMRNKRRRPPGGLLTPTK